MKSELKTPKTPDITYPCLMQASGNRHVVLFKSERCGTVLDVALSMFELGWYSDGWIMSAFEPLPEGSQVVLTA